MTRGTMIMIRDKEVISSLEFNGSMYPDGYGDEVMKNLRKITTKKGFKEYVTNFNDENFEYPEKLFYDYTTLMFQGTKGAVVDFRIDYFPRFGSDYIFIKNISKLTIKIVCKDGRKDEILPGETVRYNYGDVFEHTRKLLSE